MVKSENLYCYLLSYNQEYAENYVGVCEDSSITWFDSSCSSYPLTSELDKFLWESTTQGHEYWEELHEHLVEMGL